MMKKKIQNTEDYTSKDFTPTIFFRPVKEVLDFIIASRKLTKEKRQYILEYYLNMTELDSVFSKENIKKRKEFYKKISPLPSWRLKLREKNLFFKSLNKPKKKQKKKISFLKKNLSFNFNKKFLKLKNIKPEELIKLFCNVVDDGRLSSNYTKKKSFYDLVDYNYKIIREDNIADFIKNDNNLFFFLSNKKKINLKKKFIFKKTVINNNTNKLKNFNRFEIKRLSFMANLNKFIDDEYDYNYRVLRSLRLLFKKYKKIYYSKKKKFFKKKSSFFIRYNTGLLDRFNSELRRGIRVHVFTKKTKFIRNHNTADWRDKRMVKERIKSKKSYYERYVGDGLIYYLNKLKSFKNQKKTKKKK